MFQTLNMLASFTTPIHIGTDPASMLWMFPLLAAVSLVYKATKVRVIFWGKFFKDVAMLFLTLSLCMIAAGIAVHILVYFLTT